MQVLSQYETNDNKILIEPVYLGDVEYTNCIVQSSFVMLLLSPTAPMHIP